MLLLLLLLRLLLLLLSLVAVEFSCMRRLWIHKATAKGKNITIFQFSFVLYLDKMKKKCVFLCRLWVNQCVAFLSKRVRKASNFVAGCCWWFPHTVHLSWVHFCIWIWKKKKRFFLERKKVCTVTSRVRTEYFYVVWVLVCAITHHGNQSVIVVRDTKKKQEEFNKSDHKFLITMRNRKNLTNHTCQSISKRHSV